MVQGALASGKAGETVRLELPERRAAGVAALRRRFRRAIRRRLPRRHRGARPASLRDRTSRHGAVRDAAVLAERSPAHERAMFLRAWPT